MVHNEELSSSLEDYLEVILELVEQHSVARVKDIAEKLGVKRSSVTIALRNLSDRALVNYAPYSVITLTPEGESIARCVSRKHRVLKEFFMEVFGVDVAVADSVACKVEHCLEPEVYAKFDATLRVFKNDPELKATFQEKLDLDPGTDCDSCTDGSNNCCSTKGKQLPLFVAVATCEEGDTGIVRKILASGTGKQRLIDMGISLGVPISVLKHDTKRDTVEIQVTNYRLSIRTEDARKIMIEVQE